MPELHVDNLPALISEYADEPLESAALPRSLFEQSLDESVSVQSGVLTVLLSGEASVLLFNRPDDEDPDQIIGTGLSETSDGGGSLDPQIQFEEDRAWLKYKLQGGRRRTERRRGRASPLRLRPTTVSSSAATVCTIQARRSRRR